MEKSLSKWNFAILTKQCSWRLQMDCNPSYQHGEREAINARYGDVPLAYTIMLNQICLPSSRTLLSIHLLVLTIY